MTGEELRREQAQRRAAIERIDPYPYSPNPMGPDGEPLWGLPGHDSRIVYEPDSRAISEPDPGGRLDLDLGLLAGIDLLDRSNVAIENVGLDLPLWDLEDV